MQTDQRTSTTENVFSWLKNWLKKVNTLAYERFVEIWDNLLCLIQANRTKITLVRRRPSQFFPVV